MNPVSWCLRHKTIYWLESILNIYIPLLTFQWKTTFIVHDYFGAGIFTIMRFIDLTALLYVFKMHQNKTTPLLYEQNKSTGSKYMVSYFLVSIIKRLPEYVYLCEDCSSERKARETCIIFCMSPCLLKAKM